MDQVATSAAFYIGTYVTTTYLVNYVASKAAEKVIEGSWAISKKAVKKAANAAIDHLVKHPEEEPPIDYLEYELLEIDPDDRNIIRIVNVIEMPSLAESIGDVKLSESLSNDS